MFGPIVVTLADPTTGSVLKVEVEFTENAVEVFAVPLSTDEQRVGVTLEYHDNTLKAHYTTSRGREAERVLHEW